MILPKCATNIKVKLANFDKFVTLIKDQLEYGAKKYAQGEDKEATDLICEAWGLEWRLGEMNKRLLRYKNVQREKDLLKLATECYLVWIQMGYHLEDKHDTDTNLENK